ncbi:DUF4446 family protein [Paenibacillus flagellatus]|uniref:DUF4446 domain-containing protein n=1 Tax=Paenibacillus flagellatus TaxID=2211139 RepID=A0A2V5K1A3_9BACL|nr:DUF4446 family protein [Paenibacillus flagellatus]PYI52392.1 DUF4446 domain-containing protein [Paenibacillus flagellatus]
MNEWLDSLQPSLLLALVLVVLAILLALVLVLWVKLSKLRKLYKSMMQSVNVPDLEQLLIDHQQRLERLSDGFGQLNGRVGAIESNMKSMQSRVGMIRYNAFGDRGSDLSFSIAILSETQDGLVLTGIHSRDDTYLYAKPITAGQSQYALTPEEKEAINRCLGPAAK